MKRILIISIITLLPSCAKVSIKSEFSELKKRTLDRTEQSISMSSSYSENLTKIPDIHATINLGISREDAIRIALLNNPELRAEFENLGIAKADLVQAGLYTNPSINSVFRFPTRDRGPGTAQTNIETVASLRLSDLWQVPLNEKVSEDLLEIVSLRILTTIISLVAETQIAYDAVLAAQLRLKILEQLLTVQKELNKEVYYRQLYGYTDGLDINNADANLAIRESELIKAHVLQQEVLIHLKKIIGINPSLEPIILTSTLDDTTMLPSLQYLEDFALRTHPEMQIAHMKIRQYQDTIRLERAKIFKRVDLGVSYKKDFDKPFRGWGPYINFDIPIFDTNYAQISRALFLRDQAQKELQALQIRIKKEVIESYTLIQGIQKEIDYYKKSVIPADKKAKEFTYTYAQTMQLTAMTAYQTHIKLYEDELLLVHHQNRLRKEYAELEKTVGEKIKHIADTAVVT